MSDQKKIWRGWIVLAPILGLLVGFGISYIGYLATDQLHPFSTPLEDLNHGQLYEVMGVARTSEDCYLLLRSTGDNLIKFYKLPAKEVPQELTVGDGLIKTPTGLQRLPQQFTQP